MKRSIKSLFSSPLFLIFLFIFISLTIFFAWFPSSQQIKGCMKTTMYDVDLCPGSKSYVPLNQISKNLQNAIILTEDSAFYQHNGFDQEGIERCIEKIKEKKKIVCGGSTLTQQLAKNLFLTKEKNFVRKGLEALITIKIEQSLSKKEILERYLNVVQFGKNIFGVKAASQFYFKKQASQLTVTESAFLAMVLPNPEKYSQSYFRKDLTKFARKRLSKIINDLFKYKRIGEGDYLFAMDSLDFFLSAGQQHKPEKENVEELTTEDLNEMFEESESNH